MIPISKEWKVYCKVMGLNPYLKGNRCSLEGKEGFRKWQALQGEYRYYSYMKWNA